ncbi:MAG TPA: metalloregulator ArsR/SmtB family transcription factor [Anaerolineales bacterium]|nr:metalloregulator ArsR/SmtB family transcription factor [Anaerolineales bacterium]
MKTMSMAQKISSVLQEIAHPARIAILLSIGREEACVCHLEAKIGKRQAYISQHLMALRDAGILLARREGRFVFYSLRDPMLLGLIELAAQIENIDISGIPSSAACSCPACAPQTGRQAAYASE